MTEVPHCGESKRGGAYNAGIRDGEAQHTVRHQVNELGAKLAIMPKHFHYGDRDVQQERT